MMPRSLDTSYRSPTQALWPATKHQERCEYGERGQAACLASSLLCRPPLLPSVSPGCCPILTSTLVDPPCAVAARVHNALGTALLNNSGLRDSLVLRLGFGVQVGGCGGW